jgi:hypothetical protein
MKIDQQEYTQKLAETYYTQSISFYTELIALQVKLDFAERQIEELELKLAEHEVVDVDTSTNP